MRHGVQAETDAALRLDKATGILRRYQDELAHATTQRETAEAVVQQSDGRQEVLEKARDAAVAAVTDPGRIPMSGQTITLGGLRLVMSRDLDPVELLMAG